MLEFYISKLVVQGAWLLVFIAATVRICRSRDWPQIVQLVAATVLLFVMILDWVLFDPYLGMYRGDIVVASRWGRPQMIITSLGLLSFGFGFLASAIREKH